MNGTEFSSLNYDKLNEDANQLNTAARRMNDLFTEIDGLFKKVGTDEVWRGLSASESKANFDRYSVTFPEFVEAVVDCSNYIARMVSSYQETENAAMNAANDL